MAFHTALESGLGSALGPEGAKLAIGVVDGMVGGTGDGACMSGAMLAAITCCGRELLGGGFGRFDGDFGRASCNSWTIVAGDIIEAPGVSTVANRSDANNVLIHCSIL